MADITEQQFLSQDPEVLGLQRQRALANLLTGQAFNQPQGQIISGHYVRPSALQQALPMINAGIGALTNANLDTKQQELANMLRGREQDVVQRYMGAKTPQEQFAIANEQYAPAQLKSAAYEMLKPTVLAPDSSIVKPSFGAEGGYQTLATGPEKQTELMRNYKAAQNNPISPFPGSLLDYEVAIKRAGAPSVINQVGASLAGQAGKLFEESKATTVGGYNAIASADKILNSTNKAITGPLANARLTALQTADTLGITGKAEKEKIARTREILQETGKLALAAPPKGQGQVSNYERDLYQRAASGDINFTPTELNLVARRAKEFGEYQIQQHNELLQSGAELGPDIAKMAKLYKVNPPQSVLPVAPAAPAQTSNKVKFLGFE
jgi:hypothetical protein